MKKTGTGNRVGGGEAGTGGPAPGRKKSGRAECLACGRAFAPFALLERMKNKLGLPDEVVFVCRECKRKSYAKKLADSEKKHGG